jgi:signal peptidase II
MVKVLSRIGIRDWFCFFLVATLVVLLDQYTKELVMVYCVYGSDCSVIPGFFDISLTFNRGAAFGIFSNLQDGMRQIVLGATTILALTVVAYFLLYEYCNDRIGQLALAMVVGGALGNIIDRVTLGMVIDFFDVYVGPYHWPAFNIADSCICVAVVILLFHRPKKVA